MKTTKKPALLHSLMNLTVVNKTASKEFTGDTLGYLFFQNDKKEAQLNSATITEIQDLAKNKTFKAAAKSTFFIRASYIEKQNIIAVGLGNKEEFTLENARQTGAVVYQKLTAEKISNFGIDVDQLIKASSKTQAIGILSAFLEGFYLASYSFDKYKSKAVPASSLQEISLVTQDKKLSSVLEKLAQDSLITADCVFAARDFSNEPSNFGTPEYYADECARISKIYGLKCKALNEAEAKKEKMGLFLSVSAGSDREARVVVIEYTPAKASKNTKTVGLVGKGVTFDSGGISIKPSSRMEDMKHDMSGAASIFGATLLAARLGSKNKIFTVLMFSENMPNGIATQPGNIITARNGKTVEIINTDAEGRLVLADGLDYIQDRKPDVIINAATLTGACGVALGKLASALFSNDENLVAEIQDSCAQTQERLWQLPLFDEYFDDLKSNYADMMNSANDSLGGTIRGAIFLKQFIREGQSWAHIDLANTAYDQGYLPYNPRKGASGSYVRTIARFTLDY